MEVAKVLFAQQRYDEAIAIYQKLADDASLPNATRAQACSNQAAAYLKHEMNGEVQYERALIAAEQAIRLDPTYVKGWGRKGAALYGLKRYEEAYKAYQHGAHAAQHAANTPAAGTENGTTPHHSIYQEEMSELAALLQTNRGIASDDTRHQYYFTKYVAAGTDALKGGKHAEAITQYVKAMRYLPSTIPRTDIATLLANRSVAYYKHGTALSGGARGGGGSSSSSGTSNSSSSKQHAVAAGSNLTTQADERKMEDCLLESARDAYMASLCDGRYARAFCRLGMALLAFQQRTTLSNAIRVEVRGHTNNNNNNHHHHQSTEAPMMMMSIMDSVALHNNKANSSSGSANTHTQSNNISPTASSLSSSEITGSIRERSAAFFVDRTDAATRSIVYGKRTNRDDRRLLAEAQRAFASALEIDPSLALANSELSELNKAMSAVEKRQRDEDALANARRHAVAEAIKTRQTVNDGDGEPLSAADDPAKQKSGGPLAGSAPMQRVRAHSYQVCRYCNEYGHTSATCPVKAFHQEQRKRSRDAS